MSSMTAQISLNKYNKLHKTANMPAAGLIALLMLIVCRWMQNKTLTPAIHLFRLNVIRITLNQSCWSTAGRKESSSWDTAHWGLAETHPGMAAGRPRSIRFDSSFWKMPFWDAEMSFPDRVNVTCPPLLEDELLVSLAKKYKKTAAQLALRFNVQRGVVVIPKSFSPPRIRENFQVGFTPSAVSFKIFFLKNKIQNPARHRLRRSLTSAFPKRIWRPWRGWTRIFALWNFSCEEKRMPRHWDSFREINNSHFVVQQVGWPSGISLPWWLLDAIFRMYTSAASQSCCINKPTTFCNLQCLKTISTRGAHWVQKVPLHFFLWLTFILTLGIFDPSQAHRYEEWNPEWAAPFKNVI